MSIFINAFIGALQNFSGITSLSKGKSEIKQCAIGKCKKEINWGGRIVGALEYDYISSKNISIDSNKSSIKSKDDGILGHNLQILFPAPVAAPAVDPNQTKKLLEEAHDGESVSANLFKQRYFENTLGWDFDTVWMWDHEKDHPVLRQVGVRADTSDTPTASAQTNTADLLTQQIRANIWL